MLSEVVVVRNVIALCVKHTRNPSERLVPLLLKRLISSFVQASKQPQGIRSLRMVRREYLPYGDQIRGRQVQPFA